MAKNEFVEVAKVHEITDGKMKNVEVEGKEVLLANVNGKFYAMSDRCGHMNALLSMGNIKENIVTCPFHGARYDVTTGKKVSEPILTPPENMEPLPQTWQKFFENVGRLMAPIKTLDQIVYETRVDDDSIKIKI
ncbi:MAG TPA: Rieske 2Fe-2S domain-containing protein [Nitrososphaeraceae archaeon]|jgi:nitrite reductase/ring-hydroxylating ferredoxin subunit